MAVLIVRDSFELGQVDPAIWTRKQIEPHQITFLNDAVDEAQSIAITTRKIDGGASCTEPCQRAELRLHGRLRPDFGEEVWYGFAFKVTGDIEPTGSHRTVIGQWKAPNDDSPFLAQRFDNGVFHVTVQDGPKRLTVASAEGDPERLMLFQEMVADMSAAPALGPAAVRAARAIADLKAMGVAAAADPLTLARKSLFEDVHAAAAHTIAASPASERLFDEFNFIQELECYAERPALEVLRPAPKQLPDPKQGWVEMLYRIKGGRTDNPHGPSNQGEVDIWANGELIAEVRGNLGYLMTEPPADPTMYFKFGMYRTRRPGTIVFHFDHFRQGPRQIDVA